MLSQRDRAEKLRDKEELEAQRDALKEKLVMHRDKGEDMTAEQLEESKRDLSAFAELETRIKGLGTEIEATPESNPEIGGISRTMNAEINKDNFRASAQYRDAFYRSLRDRSVSAEDKVILEPGLQQRAITDMNGLSITSGAAYLVPETTLNTIASIITKVSPLYNLVTKYNFEGDVALPIGTEDTTVNESDGTDTLAFIFTELKLTQMAIVANVPIKNLTLKNSIKALEQFIAMSIGKYLGLQIENLIVNGNTTEWQGIVTAVGAGAKTYSEMDWETINQILGEVESPYGDEGVWAMRRKTFYDNFAALTDAEGRPLINTIRGFNGLPGLTPHDIGGRPVVFSSKVGANAVIFGDTKQFVMNISQEPIIEADASAGFQADKTIWRGKVYGGGKANFATTAFAYYTKA